MSDLRAGRRRTLAAGLPLEHDGRALETEPGSQTSLEVTYIIRLSISRIVHEKGEGRRARPGLGCAGGAEAEGLSVREDGRCWEWTLRREQGPCPSYAPLRASFLSGGLAFNAGADAVIGTNVVWTGNDSSVESRTAGTADTSGRSRRRRCVPLRAR